MFFLQRSAEWRFHMKTDCTGYLMTEMLGVRTGSLSNVFTKSTRQFHSFSLCLQYKEGTVHNFFLQQNVGVINRVYLRLQTSPAA